MSATATQTATLGCLLIQALSLPVPGEGLRAAEDRGFEPRKVSPPNRISSPFGRPQAAARGLSLTQPAQVSAGAPCKAAEAAPTRRKVRRAIPVPPGTPFITTHARSRKTGRRAGFQRRDGPRHPTLWRWHHGTPIRLPPARLADSETWRTMPIPRRDLRGPATTRPSAGAGAAAGRECMRRPACLETCLVCSMNYEHGQDDEPMASEPHRAECAPGAASSFGTDRAGPLPEPASPWPARRADGTRR